MKYFLDTEFIESGPTLPIFLISIGIVCEDGHELYRQNLEAPLAHANAWVQDNVITNLEDMDARKAYLFGEDQDQLPDISHTSWRGLKDITKDIIEFIGDDPSPEFWGYYSDYDWVVFCQIFGTTMDLSKVFLQCPTCRKKYKDDWDDSCAYCSNTELVRVGKFPMFCLDLKQLCHMLGNPQLPKQTSTEHHALADARWNLKAYKFLTNYKTNGKLDKCKCGWLLPKTLHLGVNDNPSFINSTIDNISITCPNCDNTLIVK